MSDELTPEQIDRLHEHVNRMQVAIESAETNMELSQSNAAQTRMRLDAALGVIKRLEKSNDALVSALTNLVRACEETRMLTSADVFNIRKFNDAHQRKNESENEAIKLLAALGPEPVAATASEAGQGQG